MQDSIDEKISLLEELKEKYFCDYLGWSASLTSWTWWTKSRDRDSPQHSNMTNNCWTISTDLYTAIPSAHKPKRSARRSVFGIWLDVSICRFVFEGVLDMCIEMANSQTSDYNNDWFDKGSYSHQQSWTAEECRNCNSDAQARATRAILHRKLTNPVKQGSWIPHSSIRRCPFGRCP